MFRPIMNVLQQEISGDAALGYVAEISRHHRIQASPGFRHAAEYVCAELVRLGIQAEVLSFPANPQIRYWGARMFQEWDAQEGTAYLVTGSGPDRKLADYRDDKISIIQRSVAGDVEAEVVAVDGGGEERDYEGLDVAGKVVIVNQAPQRALELAVKNRGAVGILYDGMRKMLPVAERIDYADIRQYTSFWRREGGPTGMGFVLTPRQGDELRAMIVQRAQQGKPAPRVRLHVRSEQYDGAIEVVSALIPGATDQEVVLEAHLCHPQTSCNDNASGSAALLEAARALHAAIGDGRLPAPQRGIRFLWIPEMTGTYAYFATHEEAIPRTIAGLNLDMVGEDQDKCRSCLALIRPPLSMPSFAPATLEAIFRQCWQSADSDYAFAKWNTFRVQPVPFSAGSDHYILSDPTVGIPAPMLGEFPDKYWHTNADTLDKVDPRSLGFSANLAAAYGYWLATAGPDEARWLADEMTSRFKQEVVGAVQASRTALHANETPKGPPLSKQVAFLAECQTGALNSLSRIADMTLAPWQDECTSFAQAELAAAQRGGPLPERPAPSGEWERRAAGMVPLRLFRGPLDENELKLGPEDKEALRTLAPDFGGPMYDVAILAMYWADGRRTVQAISDCVEMESGIRPTEFLVRYFELQARGGGVEMQKSGKTARTGKQARKGKG